MRWIEGWYSSYALLGIASSGLLPILLPLAVGARTSPAQLGLVLAGLSLGGLSAPLWGWLADRYRLHRLLLAGGLAGVALATGLLPLVAGFSESLPLAVVAGAGVAAASTVANLFIVEVHPASEWDARIGWLQTLYAVGQVVGLLLAGVLALRGAGIGLWVAAGVSAAAIVPALLNAPKIPAAPRAAEGAPQPRRPPLVQAARHAEWPPGSPQRHYHHAGARALAWLGASASPVFLLFLLGWLLSYAGSAAFFSLYPVVMREAYGVRPDLSSIAFAVSAGFGLFLYAPAGRWSGGGRSAALLRLGLIVRLAAYLALVLFARALAPSSGWIALGSFLLVVVAWSALSVASTAMVAGMSVANQGEGMGIFNAVTALSGVLGSVIGGAVAGFGGYYAVPVVSMAGTAAGLLILLLARFRSNVPPGSASVSKEGSS